MKNIEQLFEKYLEGNTSIDEELLLKNAFLNGNVPEHLLIYNELFNQSSNEKSLGLDDSFDLKIMNSISKHEKSRRFKFFYYISSAAAVLIIGLITLFNNELLNSKNEPIIINIDNPEQALNTAIHTLEFVSLNMNNGFSQLEHLQKLNIGLNELSKFSKFNEYTKFLINE